MATPPMTPVHVAKPSRSPNSPPQQSLSRVPTGNSIRHIEDNGVLLYQYRDEDYKIAREIGSGQFSTVYEAISKPFSFPDKAVPSPTRSRNDSVLTPPATPVKTSMDRPRRLLAVKKPADRSSAAVLRDEARILTRIREVDGYEKYVITFHGMDPRNEALIEDLMPCSLDSFIYDQLNPLPPSQRVDTVAASFHPLARHLLGGLVWLHSHGIVHGDVKPGNILLRPSENPVLSSNFRYQPIYADFSSASCDTIIRPGTPGQREAPAAGGTWDFMYLGGGGGGSSAPGGEPELNDGYGLVMTLLYYVIGASPYRAVPNRWLQMDARKQGRPVEFAMRDAELAQRLADLALREGFEDLGERLARGFRGAWRDVLN